MSYAPIGDVSGLLAAMTEDAATKPIHYMYLYQVFFRTRQS